MQTLSLLRLALSNASVNPAAQPCESANSSCNARALVLARKAAIATASSVLKFELLPTEAR